AEDEAGVAKPGHPAQHHFAPKPRVIASLTHRLRRLGILFCRDVVHLKRAPSHIDDKRVEMIAARRAADEFSRAFAKTASDAFANKSIQGRKRSLAESRIGHAGDFTGCFSNGEIREADNKPGRQRMNVVV